MTDKRALSKLFNTTSCPSPILLLHSPFPQKASRQPARALLRIYPKGRCIRPLAATAAARRLQLLPPTSGLSSEGRMKGLFASLYSPEKLRATTELSLTRHSARKSVPVSSCLFSGLAVMDYIQPQAGHKPAVYLSFPNILLSFCIIEVPMSCFRMPTA